MDNIPLATTITLLYQDDAAGLGPGFQVLGGPGGVILFDPTTESAGKTFNFEDYGNASFTFSGVPQDGDTFTIANNTSGSGDNRNALLLAALQTDGSLLNSTANYQMYLPARSEALVSSRQAEAALSTQEALRDQASNRSMPLRCESRRRSCESCCAFSRLIRLRAGDLHSQ